MLGEREFICQVHNIDNTYQLSGVSVNSSGNPWSTSIGPTAVFLVNTDHQTLSHFQHGKAGNTRE